MKIIKPSVGVMFRDVEPTDDIAVYKKLEKIGRLCYKSEEKITDDSYSEFLQRLTANNHYAIMEHQNFVVEVSQEFMEAFMKEYSKVSFEDNEFRRAVKFLNITGGERPIISGSSTSFTNIWKTFYGLSFEHVHRLCLFIFDKYNLIMQMPSYMRYAYTDHDSFNQMKILSNEEIQSLPYDVRRHHDYVTSLIVTDRGVSHEIVRHRIASYAQESTRYCNYGYGDDIQFVLPSWIECDKCYGTNVNKHGMLVIPFDEYTAERYWFEGCLASELNYHKLLMSGWSPQKARSVLNNSLKTELYFTANLAELEWFMKMRIPNSAHPDMRAISIPLQEKIIELIPEFPRV